MIITDKFIFIHNCHCGGHTIRLLLNMNFPDARGNGPVADGHWHKPLRAIYKNDYYGRKIKILDSDKQLPSIGVVRNPWDWYVSFFHHQGGNTHEFGNRYCNGRPTFDSFIRNILSKEFNAKRKDILSIPPGDSVVAPCVPKCRFISNIDVGFFTYRCIYTFCKNSHEILNNELKYSEEEWTLSDTFTLETLYLDFYNFCKKYNIVINNLGFLKNKLNRVGRQTEDYRRYYTTETAEMVLNKDKIIIDKFNYKF